MSTSGCCCGGLHWFYTHVGGLQGKKKVLGTGGLVDWHALKSVCRLFISSQSGIFAQSSSGVLIKRCNEVWTVFQGAVARIQQQPPGRWWRVGGSLLNQEILLCFSTIISLCATLKEATRDPSSNSLSSTECWLHQPLDCPTVGRGWQREAVKLDTGPRGVRQAEVKETQLSDIRGLDWDDSPCGSAGAACSCRRWRQKLPHAALKVAALGKRFRDGSCAPVKYLWHILTKETYECPLEPCLWPTHSCPHSHWPTVNASDKCNLKKKSFVCLHL